LVSIWLFFLHRQKYTLNFLLRFSNHAQLEPSFTFGIVKLFVPFPQTSSFPTHFGSFTPLLRTKFTTFGSVKMARNSRTHAKNPKKGKHNLFTRKQRKMTGARIVAGIGAGLASTYVLFAALQWSGEFFNFL
jgi:hypothetical protein